MHNKEDIERNLREGSPWQVHLFDEVGSTMDEARRLAAEYPDQNYLVAVAETQTAGLGRHARHWASSSEGLWMTALIRPKLPPFNAPWFTLAAAVAVAEALDGMGFPVGIKWPNDVLATSEAYWRRKLCGIRCEMELAGTDLAWVSLGIGLNVNHTEFPPELDGIAASLLQLGGAEVSRDVCAAAILNKLEDLCSIMEREGFAPVRERWMKLALGIGDEACVRDEDAPYPSKETCGIVRGMDDDGHLLLEVEGQEDLHAVVAGDLVFQVG